MTPTLTWLEDPAVFAVNRLPAHSDHMTYASREELAAGKTSLRQSLDGIWKFRWSKNPRSRPADFWQEGWDDSSFDTIRVPGHMETQGYGKIQYSNYAYDWDGHARLEPGKIDWEDAPVGSYVTVFDANPRWREVRISFQGVEKAMYLWLNGHFVGYSEDSFTPADFDLTPYIRPAGNRLCVEVHKRCSGGWIEDQDFFSFSGIFRSVFLYAPGKVEDLWLKTDLDGTEGTLQLRLKAPEALSKVRLTLSHPEDGVLFDGPVELERQDGVWCSRVLRFSGIRPWDHGNPDLYQAVLEADGEVIPYEVGFRRVEIQNHTLLLNGRRLVLNGVNRHEWNPHTGRAIGQADMEAAMAVFRKNNINAVRTSHYPNQSAWYDLCDRNGIYVVDETNLESHGSWQRGPRIDPEWNVPGSKPEWKECVLDRANSMFQRDKNHVSVLFWSCGNESYAGADILAMADFFRAADPSRPVHYEGVFWNREFNDCSDVESRMYAKPWEIREYLKTDGKKPFFLCEYMHDMGNSLGGMESYMALYREFPNYHGGFIWDYMDQALWKDGHLCYGGDFLDRPSDYAFSGNGIVTADGREKPCMQEVRYWYMDEDRRRAFDAENARRESAYRLPPVTEKKSPLQIIQGDGNWGVRGADFEVLFSQTAGGPVSLISQGTEWLWRAVRPAFWRAPTENDMGCGFPEKSALWQAADAWCRCTGAEVTESGEAGFAVTYRFGVQGLPAVKAEVSYRVTPEGQMAVQARYRGGEGLPELPLFGLRFETPSPIDTYEWAGLSGETYPDRYKGAAFGVYQEVPHIAPYLVPQECGNHMGTHFVRFQKGSARLELEMADAPFAFSALPYTPGQLQEAQHVWELPEPCRTVITVAGAMRGVGGIDSWGTDVEEAYRLPAGEDRTLSFRVRL